MKKPNLTNEQLKQIIAYKITNDFSYFSEEFLKIRTKDARIAPLKFNEAQKELERVIKEQIKKTKKVRIIILKGRQQGLSTAVGAYLYHNVSTKKAKKALVVAHKHEATGTLFEMTKRYHNSSTAPEGVKPETKYDSKNEITFPELDSSYIVATAGGKGIVRGETVTHVHLSEMAFWPEATAEENLNGLLQSVPNTPDTAIIIESTANGVNGPFYRLWQDAVAGNNSFYPLFIPWFWQTEYREAIPSHHTFKRTPKEEELVQLYGLDDEQLYWKRLKEAETSPTKFKQEYPFTPEEAFQTSGSAVFEPEPLIARSKELTEGPLYRKEWVLDEWIDRVNGSLCIYKDIVPGETYYIGADVSMGNRTGDVDAKGDWSVAQVLDAHGRQVAIYRGKPMPDYFAVILSALGKMFNNAKIAVEVNNHGLLTLNRLYKDLGYSNVHFQILDEKNYDIDTDNLGFRTTKKSKITIINELRAKIRDGEIILYDKVTINELLTYIVRGADKMGAENGCHDDCVMSLAIANHINEGVFKPVINRANYYVYNI